jgi:phosphoribosylformylglycinamidine synthase
MRARVFVHLKQTVLDPQGQTIQRALSGMGHREIVGVRQGKVFEIELGPGASLEAVRQELEQVAHDVLSNPVIEEYRVEILE